MYEENNKKNNLYPLPDICTGLIGHLIFLLLFYYYTDNSLDSCKETNTIYWANLTIYYHFFGVICSLIVIPIMALVLNLNFNTKISNFLVILLQIIRITQIIFQITCFCGLLLNTNDKIQCGGLSTLITLYVTVISFCLGFIIIGGIIFSIIYYCVNKKNAYSELEENSINVEFQRFN